MKDLYILFALLLIAGSSSAKDSYVENKGQITDQYHQPNAGVKYLYNGRKISVQLRKNGFSYDLWRTDEQTGTSMFHRIDINFAGCNTLIRLQQNNPSTDYLNFYINNKEVTRIHGYEQVVYKQVWPGIDISFELEGDAPKYNIIVHPGAKLSDIQFEINGANTITQNGSGLSIGTDISVIEEEIPYSYYLQGEQQQQIHASFTDNGKLYGIDVKESVPANATVIIDPIPTISWCTMYGSSGKDYGYNTVTAPNGDVYLSGSTSSPTAIATAGSYKGSYTAGNDAYVAKFDKNGKRSWATYFGGDTTELADDMAINNTGTFICISGTTLSDTGIASAGTHQTVKDSRSDIYLLVLDSAGQRQWSTYYGGDGTDELASVAIDNNNNIYLAGTTYSSNSIATTGAYKDTAPADISSTPQGVLAKFSASGNRIWGTYFGGDGGETMDLAGIYKDSVIYVSGYTDSDTGIATVGTYQSSQGGSSDLFIAAFDSAGSYLTGTYFGGPDDEYSNRKSKTDDSGYIYLQGYTKSDTMIATANAHQTTYGGGNYDALLAKFRPDLSIVWSTYYGGDGTDEMYSLAVDKYYSIYIAGLTESKNQIATPNTWLSSNPNGGQHMFLAKLDKDGNRNWGTYLLGGFTLGMTADMNNDIYLASWSTVAQVGTPGAHQQFHGGGGHDAFLMKIEGCHPNFATATSNSPVPEGNNINLTSTPSGMASYQWSHAGGFSSNMQNPTINNAQLSDSGIYTVVITDSSTCTDSATVHVVISPVHIEDIDGKKLFSIYPNPATDILHIENKSGSEGVIYITNATGQVMDEVILTKGKNIISTGNYSPGVYMLSIIHNNKTETRKIIVQR